MAIEDGLVRGEVRVKGYRRVSHGVYRPERGTRDDPAVQWLADLAAWRLVLPGDAVFTHVTAAALRGWWLPQLPEQVPVFAATSARNHPRRAGLSCARLERDVMPSTRVHGLPVDDSAEVLLRAARDLSLLDTTVLVDAALREQGDGLRAPLDEVCQTSRPGVRRLRAARDLADPRSESPWGTLLRLFHVAVEAPVHPQLAIFDADGRFVARADLWLVGTQFIHEYDGGVHRALDQQARDLRRERRLTATPYVRRGYTADDLINHPLACLRDVDEALGRRHRASRVATWRHWLAESTYTPEGRARLQNRWWRRTGIADWARTA